MEAREWSGLQPGKWWRRLEATKKQLIRWEENEKLIKKGFEAEEEPEDGRFDFLKELD